MLVFVYYGLCLCVLSSALFLFSALVANKPTYIILPITPWVCCRITLGHLKIRNFALCLRVKQCFKCDFLSSIYLTSVKCHENTCECTHCAKYQHFAVCSFTVLNKLKALQLSEVGLLVIKHQHSENLTPWAEATCQPKTDKRKYKLFATVCWQKMFKMSTN